MPSSRVTHQCILGVLHLPSYLLLPHLSTRTYHKDFNKGFLLLALLTSYLIFLFLVSAILPW